MLASYPSLKDAAAVTLHPLQIFLQFVANGKQPQKSTQTETETTTNCSSSSSSGGSCNCDAKYNKIFNDFKSRLEVDHRSDKERALKDLEHRVSKL